MGLVDLSRFVMDLTSVRLLLIVGLVVAAQAQNCIKPVAGANMGLSDKDILLDSFPNGAVASFICSVGFMSAGGSPSVTCEDGSWSPVKLTCQIKSCGSAGEIANGHIDYSQGIDFGAEAVAVCNTGYDLVGKAELVCRDKGWMGRLPTCEVITCGLPRGIENGDFSPKKEDYYKYLEVIQFVCQKPYSLKGSKSSTCSEGRVFKPDPPECIIVNCQEPVIDFGKWAAGSRPPYKHLASVTLECDTGYDMVGERTQTCDINSDWSPGLPKCESAPKPTDKPESGSDGVTQTVVIVLIAAAIIAGITGGATYFIKKKRGSQRSYPDSEAPKPGEAIPLSKKELVS
ncbi:membrane cofactor protein-like isoform X2 [Hippoglossus stenolepis]|uniref:membrane cofactor protein-like isoform X2 n=1 Tax=Hippoglossus stenolepis TaxID=195615 RepID=UPI001FAF5388|nr:membrane cofactor protein-like isoform X2 [Hippoglossus stenolepis]